MTRTIANGVAANGENSCMRQAKFHGTHMLPNVDVQPRQLSNPNTYFHTMMQKTTKPWDVGNLEPYINETTETVWVLDNNELWLTT